MVEEINKIKNFESTCSEFEFVRFSDLSLEEQNKLSCSDANDLVIVQKSFNPGFKIFPIKDNDFVGFLIEQLIQEGKKDLLKEPFSTFE